jgi:glycosyltransferase involved in cell wall biosynthesis
MVTQAKGHVLLVTPGFPADEQDDTCVPAVQEYLAALRCQAPELRVSVLALHYPPRTRRRYLWQGCDVLALGSGQRRWPWRYFDLRRAIASAQVLGRVQPFTVLHALWLSDAAWVAARLARRLGLPWVASAMGQDARASNRWLRLLPLSSARVTAPCARAAAEYAQVTGRRAQVVPWGLAPVTGDGRPWSQRRLDLLGVGALIALKDFTRFVDLAAELHRAGRLGQARLIGTGPERAALEARAAAAGLGGHFECLGALPRPRVLETMADARVLVHPARYEGFGLVLAEALAQGMAVVARPVGVAEPSERVRVCARDEDFLPATLALLAAGGDGTPWQPFPIERAVADFLRLYSPGPK